MTNTIQVVLIETLGDTGVGVISRVDMPKNDTLAALQGHVGGYVECIDVSHPVTGAVATLWFNDSGKINGLARNPYAMVVAIAGGWTGPEYGDWIAGPVVVTGLDREEGETIALPDEWLEAVATLATLPFV